MTPADRFFQNEALLSRFDKIVKHLQSTCFALLVIIPQSMLSHHRVTGTAQSVHPHPTESIVSFWQGLT